ncbi:MAG: ubiquinone/menaquinone biosynthesis methyltransferase [Chloroflexi bacterium]|nr:ubiquinone/menaquinone biosynthesis methyltransferase [Chloroflexota bacterium]
MTRQAEIAYEGLSKAARVRYIARMFGRVSGRYDLLNTVMTVGCHHGWRKEAAMAVAQGLQGDALDVATGTGDLALALARQPGMARVVGLDMVVEMVALARSKASRTGMGEWASFCRGDALALPFPDGAFVCVTSGFAMRNVVDVTRAVREMARVTQTGGRIAILEFVPQKTRSLVAASQRCYIQRMVPALGGLLSGEREAYSYLSRSVDGFQSAEQLAGTMEAAGLRSVRVRKLGLGAVGLLVGEKG